MTSEYLLFNWQVGGEPNNAAASNGEHCLEMRKGRQGFFCNDNIVNQAIFSIHYVKNMPFPYGTALGYWLVA